MKRLKVRSLLKAIGIFVLLLTFLSLFAFSIRHVSIGGKKFGSFTKHINAFANFPNTVERVLTSDELKGIHPSNIKMDSSFNEKNLLERDIYGLNSFFNKKKKGWEIRLFNFKDDSVIHRWYLDEKNLLGKDYLNRDIERLTPYNYMLLPDRQLITFYYKNYNLYRLDSNSAVIWHNTEKEYHHSLNLSVDSNIWICSSEPRGFNIGQGRDLHRNRKYSGFIDDFITKIDIETGQVIYDKSVTEILVKNGYKNFVYGTTNNVYPFSPNEERDPLHLNDIEPVLNDGKYWEKGDLFLSLRHKSLIVHYRPSSNQIVNLIFGPFLYQHDVDIYSEKEISIFNNNTTNIGDSKDIYNDWNSHSNFPDDLTRSELIIYNFENKTFRKHLNKHFIDENIYTQTDGLHEKLSNGDFYIESQNDGKMYIMNEDNIVMKKYFHSQTQKGFVQCPYWINIYENINF